MIAGIPLSRLGEREKTNLSNRREFAFSRANVLFFCLISIVATSKNKLQEFCMKRKFMFLFYVYIVLVFYVCTAVEKYNISFVPYFVYY